MKLNQLGYIIQLLERHKIPATELIVKGKDSSRLSFTMNKRWDSKLTRLCVQYDMPLTRSYDIFQPKGKQRYHITLRRAYI